MPRYGVHAAAVGFIAAVMMTVFMVSRPHTRPPAAEPVVTALLAKGDKLAAAERIEGKPIRVIPIARPVPIPAAALTPAQSSSESEPTPKQRVAMADPLTMPDKEDAEEARPARRHYGDICAAHGMRKVERGRGWRCVHARR